MGPLARVAIAYARKDKNITPLVDDALHKLGVGPDALVSTAGRTLARGLESVVMAKHSIEILDSLVANVAGGDLRVHDSSKWDPASWPAQAMQGSNEWIVRMISNGCLGSAIGVPARATS